MTRSIIAIIFSIVILPSCHFLHNGKRGTGNVVSQNRDFSNFSEVEVGSAIDLYVKQDSAFSVKVEVDDNLQQYIVIHESGGVLYIKQQDNTSLDATGKIKVYVSAPEFKRLDASGACSILSQNTLTNTSGTEIQLSGASDARLELKTPTVKADVSGASSLALIGETKDFTIGGGGSSDIKCFDLLSENTDVDVSGATHAEVFASIAVKASASGASSVYYKGKGTLTKDESGASSVKKVD